MLDIQELVSGDTPDAVFVTAQIDDQIQDMSVAGWVCNSTVLDENRDQAVPVRAITDVQSLNGRNQFRATLLTSESAQLTNTKVRVMPVTYYWCITVENLSLNYRRTTEVTMAVRKKG